MAWKIDLDPQPTRAVIIGLLIGLEAFFLPLYAILLTGCFPSPVEFATFAASAVLQEITYWLVFLKQEEKEPKTDESKKAKPKDNGVV